MVSCRSPPASPHTGGCTVFLLLLLLLLLCRLLLNTVCTVHTNLLDQPDFSLTGIKKHLPKDLHPGRFFPVLYFLSGTKSTSRRSSGCCSFCQLQRPFFKNCFPAAAASRSQLVHGQCFGTFHTFHLDTAGTRARFCAGVNFCSLLFPQTCFLQTADEAQSSSRHLGAISKPF